MDLVVIGALTLLLLPPVYLLPFEPLRLALGLLLVLFSPGYALLAVLFPRRGTLDGVERLALSIGLSLALAPLLGLALNFTPWGIRPTPIILTLSLWTLLLATTAAARRRRIAPEEQFEVRWEPIWEWARQRRRPLDFAVGGVLAVSVLAVIGVTAWRIQHPPPGEPFTEFYVLGTGGALQDYPTVLRVGQAQEYLVGIVNRERSQVSYTVRSFLGDTERGTVGPLKLKDREKWEGKVAVTPTTAGAEWKLEFRLYRDADAEPYRSLHLFVQVFPS